MQSDSLAPARRPGYCDAGQAIQILANFFAFQLVEKTAQLYKYAVEFQPDLPQSGPKQRERVFSKARSEVTARLGKYVFANTAVFSAQTTDEFEVQCEFDNVAYRARVTPTGPVEGEMEVRAFYNKFFNSVQGRLNLVMIGRKFYNPSRPVELPQHKLAIWPGYASAVGMFEGGCMVNIDISHRCLRTNTVYDQISELRNRNPQDLRNSVSKLLIGAIVLTLYNNKNYKVDDIEWDLSPNSTFKQENGNEQTYKSYYSTKWQKNIAHDDQPMLKSRTKLNEVMLIPELCVITGLTDEIRADFNIMKDMAQATKKEPNVRLTESAGLIQAIRETPKANQEMLDWKVEISAQPVSLTGHVLPAGNILLGNNANFKINDQTGSFDRDIQNAMFTQPELDKWGIFFCENDRKLVETSFMTTLSQVSQTYKLRSNKPVLFGIKGDRWNEWEETLRKTLNPTIKLIVCVLPGARGKARLYDDLKRFTFNGMPVPTQCILNATLKKDKGLRSVVNKVVMQINAKVGGIPWALGGLPCSDQPTMVIGIDVFHKANAHSVLGFCATTDRNFARYVSVPKINAPSEEICAQLTDCVYQALCQFFIENKAFPARLVVFRDGVGDSQRSVVLQGEVPQFKAAFQRLRSEGKLTADDPRIVLVVVNKRINARFYASQGGKVNNPPLGTIVDRAVTEKVGYDFYVMPAKATQGAMTPTHFHVVYDDSGLNCNELQALAYRMCYSYYNWSGSIRVPAPCQYAHKLAYQYGERANNQGPPLPHQHWATTRCLYFL
jgi:aubergine